MNVSWAVAKECVERAMVTGFLASVHCLRLGSLRKGKGGERFSLR